MNLLLSLLLLLPGASADDKTWRTYDVYETPQAQVESEHRVALVIGNRDYQGENRLENPVDDARVIAGALRGLGFQVIVETDLATKEKMEAAIQRFTDTLAQRRGGVGFIYYSGHGMHFAEENWLIPTRAVIGKSTDLKYVAVGESFLLNALDEADARLRIVALDACRDNRFYAGVKGSTGLAKHDVDAGAIIARLADAPLWAGRGALLAYAASTGQRAADGEGDTSPWAAALKVQLETPGLTIEEVFKRARDQVVRDTRGAQTPVESSTLVGQLVLKLPAAGPDLSSAWRAVLALPEAQRRDAVLAFAHRHAQSGAPEVAAAITWLMEHPGGGERVVTIQAPAPAASARSTGHQPGERMVSSSGIPLRWVPETGPEGFAMGSDEGPVQVVLTEGRWVMESEVTQAMYNRHFNDPSSRDGDLRPVEQVTWCEAVAFADRLSVSEGLTPAYGVAADFAARECSSNQANKAVPLPSANGYRLLTEAEWEWSAGIDWPVPNDLRWARDGSPRVNWFDDGSPGPIDVCTSSSRTSWGLCDMDGNVWEWVQDSYSRSLPGGSDPLVGPGPQRIYRGGEWGTSGVDLRVSSNRRDSPGSRHATVGFRLSRSE